MTAVRQAAAEISPRREVDGALTAQTPLNELIDAWWVLKQKSGLKGSTLQKIKENLTLHVRPQVGSWPIEDATAMRLDQVIQKTLENKGVLPSRSMRSNLNQVLALAVRWGLLDQNPIPQTAPISVPRREVKALSPTQAREFRAFVRSTSGADEADCYVQQAEIIDVMLGSAIRIGEALALRWSRVNGLDTDHPTITIDATLTRDDTGLIFSEMPKTSGSTREVRISGFAADALRRAAAVGLDGGPHDLVFPSLRGRDLLRQPAAVRDWITRLVQGTQWEEWTGTHLFRKTAATAVAMGHAGSDTARKHYVKRATLTPDVTSILDSFE